ncbi:unnamed protein product [Rhodiola kirilowii]
MRFPFTFHITVDEIFFTKPIVFTKLSSTPESLNEIDRIHQGYSALRLT